MDIPKEVQDKLAQFQNLQNQLQMIVLQKQQLTLQNTDIDNASNELKAQAEGAVYRMAGPLLIQTTKDDASKYLTDEREMASAKITVLEKQEKKLVNKLNEMRSDLQNLIQPPGAG